MAIVAEISGKATTVFPENKIVLLSGRSLDCYSLPPSEGVGAEVMGKEECELFVRNAFYLCAHRERIMSDSRMFLCPVAVRNGLAYTGTAGFTRPTLGVYLEWWLTCAGAMQTDRKGRRLLVCIISGSPLSGRNHCLAVREDDKQLGVTLSPFINHWSPFMTINQRYTEAKYKYECYTLQQVLDILRSEDHGDHD